MLYKVVVNMITSEKLGLIVKAKLLGCSEVVVKASVILFCLSWLLLHVDSSFDL